MDDTIQETDGAAPSNKEKAWKKYSPKAYRDTVGELVHFSSKTVNSNAVLAGIRLASDSAFEAPYVAVRTLMARGVSLSLDYGKGGAAVAGVCKQVNAVAHDDTFAEQASPEDRVAIEEAMKQATTSPYCVGTDFVDHRLRQILIPRKGAEGGYVSLTPITAGGLCELLFAKENGLVTRHNAAVEEDKKRSTKDEEDKDVPEVPLSERRKIRQAQFSIGGSKSQNVSGFRAMQRPLFMDAPHSVSNLKIAFSVYYQGISLDFSKPGVLREALEAYAGFRRRHRLDEEISPMPGSTHMEARQEEKDIIVNIATVVLQLASEARQVLLEYTGMLPSEDNPETGTPALVSPKLKAVMRGLFDCDLRDAEWSRNMAWLVLDHMEKAVRSNGNKYLILDKTAEVTVVGYLEGALR